MICRYLPASICKMVIFFCVHCVVLDENIPAEVQFKDVQVFISQYMQNRNIYVLV